MKPSLNKTLFQLAKATTIAFTVIALNGGTSTAAEVEVLPNPVTSGLYNPTAPQRFFEEGRNRFEREIHLLRQRQRSSGEPVLRISDELPEKVNEDLRRRETLSPLNNPTTLPSDGDR